MPVNFCIVGPGHIADFVRAVEQGGEPEVPGTEGLKNVEILAQAA